MSNELIERMTKLQVLCARWIERNTNIEIVTNEDLDFIITSGKSSVTYADAVDNLNRNISKYCKSKYLLNAVAELKYDIYQSQIKDIRIGADEKLDYEAIKTKLFMIGNMKDIRYVSDKTGIAYTTIKQACLQNRLLNTQKMGKNWVVHIPEVMKYWSIDYEHAKIEI